MLQPGREGDIWSETYLLRRNCGRFFIYRCLGRNTFVVANMSCERRCVFQRIQPGLWRLREPRPYPSLDSDRTHWVAVTDGLFHIGADVRL